MGRRARGSRGGLVWCWFDFSKDSSKEKRRERGKVCRKGPRCTAVLSVSTRTGHRFERVEAVSFCSRGFVLFGLSLQGSKFALRLCRVCLALLARVPEKHGEEVALQQPMRLEMLCLCELQPPDVSFWSFCVCQRFVHITSVTVAPPPSVTSDRVTIPSRPSGTPPSVRV